MTIPRTSTYTLTSSLKEGERGRGPGNGEWVVGCGLWDARLGQPSPVDTVKSVSIALGTLS